MINQARLEDGGNYTCGTANAEKGMVTVYVSDGQCREREREREREKERVCVCERERERERERW